MPKRLTLEEFIKKAKKIHGEKYDYSKVVYINGITKVCIICSIHGEFWQNPESHLHSIRPQGCPKCSGHFMSLEYFKEKSKKLHGNKYDYGLVVYKHTKEKVCIICPIHGEFWIIPNSHLLGYGCPKCAPNYHYTTEEWIEEAKKIHGECYDYSKVVYVNTKTKVCIICQIHGEFWQKPNNHLNGNGCKHCKESKTEKEITEFLSENNINFEHNYYPSFLTNGLSRQSLDFYLPDYNIAIECQGEQHFKSIEWFGGEEAFKKTIERDGRKFKKCEENNVEVLYYTKSKKDIIPDEYYNTIFFNKKQLLDKILKK
jgi:hypothetical protein